MSRRKVSRVLLKIRKCTRTTVEHLLGYTTPAHRSGRSERLSTHLHRLTQLPLANPQAEDGSTGRGSVISYQWCPASQGRSAARRELYVCNPDLSEEVSETRASDLGASVPIITITPPDDLTAFPAERPDCFQSPQSQGGLLNVPVRKLNGSRTRGSPRVVKRSEPVVCPPTAEPSTPAPTSSGQSPIFMTDPSSSVASAREDSPLNSLHFPVSVGLGHADAPAQTRWAIKTAQIESFTEKLKQAKRELGEIEAQSRES